MNTKMKAIWNDGGRTWKVERKTEKNFYKRCNKIEINKQTNENR